MKARNEKIAWLTSYDYPTAQFAQAAFAMRVANSIIFMDKGQIIETNDPHEFFNNPQNDRTKLFLSQILDH